MIDLNVPDLDLRTLLQEYGVHHPDEPSLAIADDKVYVALPERGMGDAALLTPEQATKLGVRLIEQARIAQAAIEQGRQEQIPF